MRCRMPKSDQVVDPSRYQIIPRTLIFVVKGEQVLLLKGAETKRIWAGKYNGIGGHIERGEDAAGAARRELLEETGLHVDDLRLCGTLIVDASPGVGIGIFIFRAEYSGGELLDSPEGMLEWHTLDDLGSLRTVEDLPVLLPRVMSMQPDSAPFSARSFYDDHGQLQVVFAGDFYSAGRS